MFANHITQRVYDEACLDLVLRGRPPTDNNGLFDTVQCCSKTSRAFLVTAALNAPASGTSFLTTGSRMNWRSVSASSHATHSCSPCSPSLPLPLHHTTRRPPSLSVAAHGMLGMGCRAEGRGSGIALFSTASTCFWSPATVPALFSRNP